jgi:polyvinyl alcohol dehydrogenase (cytochrome)
MARNGGDGGAQAGRIIPALLASLLVAVIFSFAAIAAEPGEGAPPIPPAARCAGEGAALDLAAPQWNGWGRDAENSRYQPAPGLTADEVPKLKVKWAFGYFGAPADTQPTIMGNRLYVADMAGRVYSLDARSGCIHWAFEAGAGVRAAISLGALPSSRPRRIAVYFGDLKAVIHALDAASGAPLWQTRIDEHPMARITGAPILYRDRIYVPVSSGEEGAGLHPDYECCKFRGSVVALDAATGRLIWKRYAIPEVPKAFKKNSAGTTMYGPAGAAIWSTPTIDAKRRLIYVGTGNSYTDLPTGRSDAILALNMDSGAVAWARQLTPNDNFLAFCGGHAGEIGAPGVGNCPKPVGADVDFGSSLILRSLPGGRQAILAGQKSGAVYALDPAAAGKILWQDNLLRAGQSGGVEWGPAADARTIYVALLAGGIAALRIADGRMLWRRPAPEPICHWDSKDCSAAQSAAVTAVPGVVFSGSFDGHLRAYATTDGAILWDYDTARQFVTVEGLQASGASLDIGGPTLAGGALYVNTGYSHDGTPRDNILLAFTPDGR